MNRMAKRAIVLAIMLAALVVLPVAAMAAEVATAAEFEAALAAAASTNLGDVTITIPANTTIKGNFVVEQVQGTNVTIKGDGKTSTINGQLKIDGNSRSTGAETLTIEGLIFDATGITPAYFIGQDSRDGAVRYPHNVTIKNCVFKDTDQSTVAVTIKQGFNNSIIDCEADGVHSLYQGGGGGGFVVISGCDVTNSDEGINLGTIKRVVIEDCSISVNGYAIRADMNMSGNNTLEIMNNKIDAEEPVVLRKEIPANSTFTLDVNDNTFYMPIAEKDNWLTVTDEDIADINVASGDVENENSFIDTTPTPTPAPTATPAPDTSNMPQTGDNSNLALFALLLTASAAGMMLLMRRKAAQE